MDQKGKKRFILTIPDVFDNLTFEYAKNNEPKFPWAGEEDKTLLEQAKKYFPGFAGGESSGDGDDCYGGPPKIYIKKEDIEKITVSVEREKQLEGLKLKNENLEKELEKVQDKREAFYGLEITFEKKLKRIDKLEEKLKRVNNVVWNLNEKFEIESELLDTEDINPNETFETPDEVESELFDLDVDPNEKFEMPDEPEEEMEIITQWSEFDENAIKKIVKKTAKNVNSTNFPSKAKKKAFEKRKEKPNEFLYRYTVGGKWTTKDQMKWDKKIQFYKENIDMWQSWGLFSSDFDSLNGIGCWGKNKKSLSPLIITKTKKKKKITGKKRKLKVLKVEEPSKKIKSSVFCGGCEKELNGVHSNWFSSCTICGVKLCSACCIKKKIHYGYFKCNFH